MFDGGMGGWEMGMVGGAIGSTLLVKAYDWWTNRRRDSAENEANVTLIAGLAERISTLETRLRTLENDYAAAQQQLYAAQRNEAQLGIRVLMLENEVRRLGGVVPEHPLPKPTVPPRPGAVT